MSKDFIELTKENLPTGKMNSGKIIKGSSVKIGNKSRLISGEFDKNKTQKINDSENKKDNKNTFTINPQFNDNELEELDVSCSCGNQTKIVFNKDEQNIEENFAETPPNESETLDPSQIVED